jgi:MFS family permease
LQLDLPPSNSIDTIKEKTAEKPGIRKRLTTLNSLKYIDFRWLMLANLMSFMSIGMQQVNRGWLILRLTDDSPLALTFVTMAFALPMTFVSLLGGALADRIPRRKLMIISQVIGVIMVFILATLDYTGLIKYWHLIVIGVVNGSLAATNMPSRQTIISDIVPKDELMNAISLSNAAMNGTRIVGPALAGVLIMYIGTAGVFYLIGIIQIISVFFVYLMETGREATGSSDKSVSGDIFAGFQYAMKNPVIMGLVLLSLVPSIFGFPYISLIPAWAREALDAQSDGLGYLMTMMGCGSLSGTLILASVKQLKNRGVFLIVNGFFWGFALLFFSGCNSYGTALPWIFAVGFISSIFMALNNTLMQIKSSDEMRGRMVSLSMMTFGIMPLSAVPFGVLAEYIGTPGSLMIAGVLLCAFMLFFYVFTPGFRRLSR